MFSHQMSNRSGSDSVAPWTAASKPLSRSPSPAVCPSISASFLLRPNDIPLYGYTLGYLSIHQLMDISVVTTLWAVMNNCYEHLYTSFLWIYFQFSCGQCFHTDQAVELVSAMKTLTFEIVLIYLFLAALGLHRYTQASCSCDGRAPLWLWRTGFSPQWLLLLQSTGSRARAQQLWHMGSVAPWHVGSSRTKDRTRIPRIGRRILYHWATG